MPRLRFLSSRSGITKIIVIILIVLLASTSMAISYYAMAQHLSQNTSQTSTPSPLPTFSSAPTSIPTAPKPTPTTIITPTPTCSDYPTLTPSPELTTLERIRNSIIYYVESNHPETFQFMTNLVWTGGRATPPNLVGAETYMYYSQGWNVTINYPVYPNTIYKIVADYSANSIGIPYRIIWKGTWQNEVINETSYVFAQ
jgi:hypothetical protein